MEAAGIEPASAGSEAEEAESSDLPSPDAGRNASNSGHEVAPHSPWSKHGRSGKRPALFAGPDDELAG